MTSTISKEIQEKTYNILFHYNTGQLLWVFERYYTMLNKDNNYTPFIKFSQKGIKKEIPPSNFSDIIVMNVEIYCNEEKKEHNFYIMKTSYNFLEKSV